MLSNFISIPKTAEILSRMGVNPIYIMIAILFGFASILALSKGVSESIAGLAIVTILPPAVVSGISSVAFPSQVMNPLILTLDKLIGLTASGLIATLVLDIGPRKYYEKSVARRFIKRTSIVILTLLTVLVLVSVYMI